MKSKTCLMCGATYANNQHGFYYMEEVKPLYAILGLVDVCGQCAPAINSYVNYYGKKSESDKLALKNHMLSGVKAREVYAQMMNTGYF